MTAQKEILDYAEYVTHSSSHGRSRGEWFVKGDLFFQSPHWCMFCNSGAQQCYGSNDHKSFDHQTLNEVLMDEAAYECGCGWWSVYRNYRQASCGNNLQLTEVVHNAILRRFDCGSLSIPLDVLRGALINKGELLHAIHPRKMELLVKSVLEDFFHCEVEHCGRSGDGGIDLLFVLAEQPVIVQVKRRRDPHAVEPASAIRELIGAAVIHGVQQAIFVTTADHFSRQSTEEAQTALLRRAVTRFDLIDRHRFLSIFHLVQPVNTRPWRKHLLSPKEEKKGHVSTLDMINFACDCEAIIHSDKSKIGYAVKCANCGRIIVLRSRRIQRKS